MLKQSGFMATNDIKILVVNEDYAETQHRISEASLNLYGYVHGGLYFSLADASAGLASRSNGETYVTLNSSFNFMNAAKEGVLRACASVINRTNRICVVDVRIIDKNEEVLSSGTFTMYKVVTR